MTRKDFVLIAEALRSARPIDSRGVVIDTGELRGWEESVRQVVSALRTTNPRFDAPRFYVAAGMDY